MNLNYNQQSFIVARDRAGGYVLLGGLGAMGVGEGWRKDDGSYSAKEGYDEAPEKSSEGDLQRLIEAFKKGREC